MKSRERHTHYLRPNHGTSVPRNLVFVEVHPQQTQEGNDKTTLLQRIDFGVAHAYRMESDGRPRWDKCVFTDPTDFWKWAAKRIRPRTSLWMIGSGIGRTFTLLNGWALLDSGEFKLIPHKRDGTKNNADDEPDIQRTDGLLVDGDPPTIILLHTKGGTIHVVDVENYGRATIEELAQVGGQTLLERPPVGAPFIQWDKWLSHRVQAVREYFVGLINWWNLHDLGTWRHTAGSLSMSAYRHRFMKVKILIHDCPEALILEREALAGGEFRCFRVGKVVGEDSWFGGEQKKKRRKELPTILGPVYVLDTNSLYPFVMSKRYYPRELITWKSPATVEDIKVWSEKLMLIARVEVEAWSREYPFVHDGERYWCRGKFITTLCGPELMEALNRGEIRNVHMLSAYWPGELFTDWVNHWHAYRLLCREEKKPMAERLAKLIMCSLSGKWGQRKARWDFVQYPNAPYRWGTWPVLNVNEGTIKEYRAIAGSVQERGIDGEALESAPAIEAYINCYGRQHMTELRRRIRPGALIYQASDGFHVTKDGFNDLSSEMEKYPGELGKLRLEGIYQWADYRGPHDYTVDGTHVIAGMVAGTEVNERGEYVQTELPSLRSILTREPGGILRIRNLKHQLGGYHPRGILNRDGTVDAPVFWQGSLYLDRLPVDCPLSQQRDKGKPAVPG